MKRTTLLLIILFSFSFTQDRSVVITGTCLLEGESDHSDVAVFFQAASASAENNTFYTDEDGAFVAGLPEGIYIVSYSHDGFLSQALPGEINFFSDIELESLTLLSGTIMEVSGNLAGNQHWTPNFQYRVTDDLTLNSGDTLTIDPGVNVLFMGEYEFLIQGAFYANGAEGDSIRFTSGLGFKNKGDWQGLLFYGDSTATSFLNYTVVEYGGGSCGEGWCVPYDANVSAMEGARLLIYNSHIHSSSSDGIVAYGNNSELTLNNSLIHNNDEGGVWLDTYVTANINGNHIHGNTLSGVYLDTFVTADINGNHIHDNDSQGIWIQFGVVVDISGNDIHDNSKGVFAQYNQSGYITVSGNAIYNCSNGVRLFDSSSNIFGNLIINQSSYGIHLSNGATSNIHSNNIIGNFNGVRIDESASFSEIKNNILLGNDYVLVLNSESEVLNNSFYNNSTPFSGDYVPSAFGEVITVNANGDSTDTWSNLFMDPMLIDIENGDYTPQEGSPVIDAGHPDDIDPDGSIADIGMLYFDWGTEAPIINSINADNQAGSSPLIVQFSSDISGPATSRQWQFGDGGSSSSSNPVHIYSIPGSYTVALTVDGPGGSASLSELDFIIVSEPTSPPVANFNSDIQSGLIPFDVQFSNFSQNEIDSYLWDFGDGSTSDEESPNHTYESEGIFTVSLTAIGPYGENALIFENYISAYEPEAVVANFELSETECVTPCSITLTNNTIGSIDSYSWDFGDGGMSSEESPVYTYEDAGEYIITLEAIGMINTDTLSQPITVLSPAPIITSISDVPDDQGGRVYITFKASGYDDDGIDRLETYQVERLDDIGWVGLNNYSAYGNDSYNVEASTLTDSTSQSDGIITYRVIATMDEGIWESNSYDGYSIDNLSPSPPTNFIGSYIDGTAALQWDAPNENDISHYNVYRNDVLLAETVEWSYIDSNINDDYEYYLTTVDIHENEGLPTEAILIEIFNDFQLGDTNFDGIVDILDIVRIVNQIMGNSEFNDDEFTAADFNADGIVDILDIVQIVNYILAN
jgi:PKD repeat protein